MEINYIELLTKKQKEDLAEIAFNKVKYAIENIEIKPFKLDIGKIIMNDIDGFFSDGNGFLSYEDGNKIGAEIAKIIIAKFKKGQL